MESPDYDKEQIKCLLDEFVNICESIEQGNPQSFKSIRDKLVKAIQKYTNICDNIEQGRQYIEILEHLKFLPLSKAKWNAILTLTMTYQNYEPYKLFLGKKGEDSTIISEERGMGKMPFLGLGLMQIDYDIPNEIDIKDCSVRITLGDKLLIKVKDTSLRKILKIKEDNTDIIYLTKYILLCRNNDNQRLRIIISNDKNEKTDELIDNTLNHAIKNKLLETVTKIG